MNPDPSELLGTPAPVDLVVKEFGDSHVVKHHRHRGAALPDQYEIFNEQQVTRARDPEASNFGRTIVTQKEQLRPSPWTEPQFGLECSRSPPPYRALMFHVGKPYKDD